MVIKLKKKRQYVLSTKLLETRRKIMKPHERSVHKSVLISPVCTHQAIRTSEARCVTACKAWSQYRE